MNKNAATQSAWPALPYEGWRDTYATLHMWMQIAGKVCLAATPRTNHFWNIAFQIAPRGLTTPTLVAGSRAFTMTFDFVDHQLAIECSDGPAAAIALRPRTVADFYQETMATLDRLGLQVRIWPMPVEIENPIRFDRDTTHHSYDPAAAQACWRILVAIKPVFDAFRARFIGKCSPVHFFWGSFDLAVTRFSGKRAPERDGADAITREAYSHEVISHGWWPGNAAYPAPAFYAYAAPEPPGMKTAQLQPAAAEYNTTLSEFLLPYDKVRTAADPAGDLMKFLTSTYDAAADSAHWDRRELERS